MVSAPPPTAFRTGRYVSWLIVVLMGAASIYAVVIGYLNWRAIGV